MEYFASIYLQLSPDFVLFPVSFSLYPAASYHFDAMKIVNGSRATTSLLFL